MSKILIFMMMSVAGFSSISNAHPGRTASDGCHYCRTNCDYWGVPWNQRHCHYNRAASEDELESSSIVYKHEDEYTSFVTLLKNDTFTTFETKKAND